MIWDQLGSYAPLRDTSRRARIGMLTLDDTSHLLRAHIDGAEHPRPALMTWASATCFHLLRSRFVVGRSLLCIGVAARVAVLIGCTAPHLSL